MSHLSADENIMHTHMSTSEVELALFGSALDSSSYVFS